MSYYYKLEQYATRMIQAPDAFMFRTQLVAGLLANIIAFILNKGCTTETSTVEDILYFAHEAEEVGKMTRRFREKKHIMDSTKSKGLNSSIKLSREKEQSPEKSHEQTRVRSDRHDRQRNRDEFKYHSSRVTGKEARVQDDKGRHHRERHDEQCLSSGGGPPRPGEPRSDRRSDDCKSPTCYSCGGQHYSTDKKCPNFGQPKQAAKMYATREGSATETDHSTVNSHEWVTSSCDKEQDVHHPLGHPTKERLAAACSDSEEVPSSEYSSAVSDIDPIGLQYSSDGALYNYDSDYSSQSKRRSVSEHFGAIREVLLKDEPDSCPSGQSVSSSADSDDESDPGIVSSFKERLGVMFDNLLKGGAKFKGPPILRKSSKKIARPPRTELDNRCFVARMRLRDLEAYVLLDSGCTSDSISPEFATSANLKVYELEEPVPLQLGTVGSRSKINFGLFTSFEIGKAIGNHYFDVVNIDRYDAILGTVFMRKHSIVLDFERDEVCIQGTILETVIEGESTFRQARRYAM
jgi:hypothetical protein